MTQDQNALIQKIAGTLQKDTRVRAMFLSGSHGNGMADAYSDLDFVMATSDGPSDAMAKLWHAAVETIGEVVLWWDRTTSPHLINAITKDWVRLDLILLKPDQLGHHSQARLKPVFDHDELYHSLKVEAPSAHPDPARLTYQIEEFVRILGLLDLVLGRKEYINGVLGVFHLRNLLVEVLIQQTGAPHRGGMLHLNRLITQEQQALMLSLPPPIPERQALIDVHLAYAKAFLPRARVLADTIGANWPSAFENATWNKLQASLGIERP